MRKLLIIISIILLTACSSTPDLPEKITKKHIQDVNLFYKAIKFKFSSLADGLYVAGNCGFVDQEGYDEYELYLNVIYVYSLSEQIIPTMKLLRQKQNAVYGKRLSKYDSCDSEAKNMYMEASRLTKLFAIHLNNASVS